MKYLLVLGLCLVSFHVGAVAMSTEGYKKGLSDAIQWNCGEAVK